MTQATPLLRVVVLVSGRGSNLQAIAAQARAGALPIRIEAVVSDRADAGALEWARVNQIAVAALSPRDYADRDAYGRALGDLVASYEPQLVILAGFMRILSDEFVLRFAGRMLNIHPSLLPRYPGLHTHRRALAAGDREHGASVHFVTPELDGGPVVIQARVPVLPGDDEDTLAARVLRQEHVIFPPVYRLVCGGAARPPRRRGVAGRQAAGHASGTPQRSKGRYVMRQVTSWRARVAAIGAAWLLAAPGAVVAESTTAAPGLQPYTARYQVSYRGLNGGEIESKFKRSAKAGQWQYETHVFPTLLARVAISSQAHELSVIEATAAGIRPLSFNFDDGSASSAKDVRLRLRLEGAHRDRQFRGQAACRCR